MKNEIYNDYEFDENEDIIIPSSIWGEIYYIFVVLFEILKMKQNKVKNLTNLKRQILFFFRWLKNN